MVSFQRQQSRRSVSADVASATAAATAVGSYHEWTEHVEDAQLGGAAAVGAGSFVSWVCLFLMCSGVCCPSRIVATAAAATAIIDTSRQCKRLI